MSVNIYLNNVPEENRGATRILRHNEDYRPGRYEGLDILGKVQPVQGTASIFRDTVWHDGEELVAGEKYLLRSDVMYEREEELDFEKICRGLGGTAKVNKALNISYALQDGGNFLAADEWRAGAFKLNFFN
jgi:hypothetical protein